MNKVKNYNISADIIRIIAAFFVVFSHSTDVFVLWTMLKGSISWEIVYYLNTLSRVAVPLFVILSGHLVLSKEKTTNIREFYKRRFSRILIPFLVWLIIYYGWAIYWDQIRLTPQYILQTLWSANIWHLYFLIIILELYILAPFLANYMETKDRKKQTFLFWSLVILGILCAVLANLPGLKIDLAKNFFTIFIPYIGYFYAGAYLRSIQISKVQAVVLGALYLILAFITNMIAKGNMSAFIVFNYGPTLFPMSIFLFLALKNIDQFFKNKIFSRGIITLIPFIASTTFGIYLLHFMVLDLVRKYFKLYPWQVHAPLVLYACLPAVLTFLITFTIVLLARKIPYSKYIFG